MNTSNQCIVLKLLFEGCSLTCSCSRLGELDGEITSGERTIPRGGMGNGDTLTVL